MAANNIVIMVFVASAALVGCSSASTNIKNGVVPNITDCRINSTISSEIAKSQMLCHQGLSGDGVQVLLSRVTRDFSVSSDTTNRELTSIFIQPANAIHKSGPIKFDAYYSRGLFDLTGKAGCVGVLEDGEAEIDGSGEKRKLKYSLRFKLVSPLGWPDDCKEAHSINGSIEL